MTIYSAVLFIHVVSAIGLFIALAAEGAILFRIRSAQSVDEARFFIRVFQRLRIVAIPSFLGVLVGGMYLAVQVGQRHFLDSVGSGRDRIDHVDRRTRIGDTDCSPEEGGFKC